MPTGSPADSDTAADELFVIHLGIWLQAFELVDQFDLVSL
jgi:hypothetical protein